MQNEMNNTDKEDNDSFAMEILSDYKKKFKGVIVALIIVSSLWFLTIAGIVGGAIYLLTNFDLGIKFVSQDEYGNNYGVVDSSGVTFGSDNTSSQN